MKGILILLCLLVPSLAFADSVFAVKTIRAKDLITPENVQLRNVEVPGAAQNLETIMGLETKRAVYAGRPILNSNITEAALIERNQVVQARFSQNGLMIETEARALERGAVGDTIRAMNLTSRAAIRAEVLEDGRLKVLP